MDDLDAELFGNKKKISIQNQQMTPPKVEKAIVSLFASCFVVIQCV